MIYEINGKQIDLKTALPLTLGDYEDLEGKGIGQRDFESLTFKQMRVLVEFVLNKANKTVTVEDARGLTIVQLKDLQAKINAINGNEKPNFPT